MHPSQLYPDSTRPTLQLGTEMFPHPRQHRHLTEQKKVNTPNQPTIPPMFKSSAIRTTRERTTSLVVVTTTHLLTCTPTLVENAAALTARTDEAGLSQTEPRRETQPAARKKKRMDILSAALL